MTNLHVWSKEPHQFSFYYVFSKKPKVGELLEITDSELFHRLSKVLRASPGNLIQLFDGIISVQTVIEEISKRSLITIVKSVKNILSLQPSITLFLPILKRSALDESITNALETGVANIQLYTSEHGHRSLNNDREFERLFACARAGAEQAKFYEKISISKPTPLNNLLEKHSGALIVFHQSGKHSSEVIQSLRAENDEKITVVVGPEADFCENEINLLKTYQAKFCLLTPTILRSPQAVAVGCGMIRSLLTKLI